MKFLKVQTKDVVIEYLAKQINSHMAAGKKVLWLVPGGSAIVVVVEVAKMVDSRLLTVMLTDERYGPVGHPDSNWQQLLQAGFAMPRAVLIPVLYDKDDTATTRGYAQSLGHALAHTDFALGFFGLGADGHTAGILPHSPAVESDELAVFYETGEYQRITMTPKAIGQLDEAVVYAVGQVKREALEHLRVSHPAKDQPAQVLKQVAKVTIFNDQIGETV